MLAQTIPLFIRVTPGIGLEVGGVTVLDRLLSALVPAWRASRQNPAKVFSEAWLNEYSVARDALV